jgi:hypothetical protein
MSVAFDGQEENSMSSSTRQLTCNTGRMALNEFLWDSETELYYLVEDEDEGGDLRRNLLGRRISYSSTSLGEEDSSSVMRSSIIPTDTIERRFLQDDSTILYGRQCLCAETDHVYCPVGAELCRIIEPNSFTYEIQCEGEVQGMVGRFIFPLVLFWYIFFACLIVASPKGKYAQGYLRRLLCCWKEDRYERALGQEIDRMAERQHRIRLRMQQQRNTRNPRRVYYTNAGLPISPYLPEGLGDNGNTGNGNEATLGLEVAHKIAVALKTRVYHADTADDAVHECAICLTEFQDGERVGDLRCGHVFHVEPCLKRWIVRRNHCPLCQANNLAAPLHEQPASADTAGPTTEEGTSLDAASANTSPEEEERASVDP